MNSTIKGLIKKTPPMKWLLGKINKLEKAQKDEIKKREECIQQLQNETAELRREMKYLYYKGLHPDQYAENLKEWYEEHTGKTLNLEHPETYNEKLQWMKLYDSTPLKTRLADKYLVREWVAEKIGEKYLIPLLGVYDKFDDIDFAKLPNKFVIKTNHSWAANRIVTDKSQFDIKEAREFFNKKMKENFAFRPGLELHYKDIIPKIIVEEYLENNENNLDDYKVFCFDGKAHFIEYMTERKVNVKTAMYDRNWNLLPFTRGKLQCDKSIERPICLKELISLAEVLSKGFPHVRVDFYCLNDGSIKFGEMTFTTASGIGAWNPDEYDKIFGDCIKLPIDG